MFLQPTTTNNKKVANDFFMSLFQDGPNLCVYNNFVIDLVCNFPLYKEKIIKAKNAFKRITYCTKIYYIFLFVCKKHSDIRSNIYTFRMYSGAVYNQKLVLLACIRYLCMKSKWLWHHFTSKLG